MQQCKQDVNVACRCTVVERGRHGGLLKNNRMPATTFFITQSCENIYKPALYGNFVPKELQVTLLEDSDRMGNVLNA
jgi:hypothetical protein